MTQKAAVDDYTCGSHDLFGQSMKMKTLFHRIASDG